MSMKNTQKHIIANLLKANAAISFFLLLLMAFLAACSTPTISSDNDSVEDDSAEDVLAEDDSAEDDSFSSSDVLKESMFNSQIDYGSMTDSRDGQVYRTVEIGKQTWMAENLNFKTVDSYCYEDNASNCTRYGRLYLWDAAASACPNGWHLPTNSEWETLFEAVGGRSVAGTALKSQTGWESNGNGTDDYGFSAFPAGYRNAYGGSRYGGRTADIWTATEKDSERDRVYFVHMSYSINSALLSIHNKKKLGCSVRCLKD